MSAKQTKTLNEFRASLPQHQIRGGRNLAVLLFCGLPLAIVAAFVLAVRLHSAQERRPLPATLAELLVLRPAEITQLPLTHLNLLCASGLWATNEPDLKGCQASLEAWAGHIRSETARHRYRFEKNPAEFENSEGLFRMLMLCVVLAEDYGVHYDVERRSGPEATRADDRFFADPSTVFLHGLLGPERKGTCSSLPVLYVALGRQLGYPLKLVTTRGHLFVRWEGEGERFNVEATAQGLSRFSDDYYRHWPFEISPEEEAAEGYLKSLAPPEELAAFLSIRGMCLREEGRLSEAVDSFAAATKLAPGCRSYATMLSTLKTASGNRPNQQHLAVKNTGQSARN